MGLRFAPGTLNLCTDRDILVPRTFIPLRPWDSALTFRLVSCPLCDRLASPAPFKASLHGCAIPDGFPVSPGRTLVVSRRHESNLFALAPEEQADLWALVRTVRNRLAEELHTDDFTVGANVGVAAGQTVLHAHIHVIPITMKSCGPGATSCRRPRRLSHSRSSFVETPDIHRFDRRTGGGLARNSSCSCASNANSIAYPCAVISPA